MKIKHNDPKSMEQKHSFKREIYSNTSLPQEIKCQTNNLNFTHKGTRKKNNQNPK